VLARCAFWGVVVRYMWQAVSACELRETFTTEGVSDAAIADATAWIAAQDATHWDAPAG